MKFFRKFTFDGLRTKLMSYRQIKKEYKQTDESMLKAIDFINSELSEKNSKEVAPGMRVSQNSLYGDIDIGKVTSKLFNANIKITDLEDESE